MTVKYEFDAETGKLIEIDDERNKQELLDAGRIYVHRLYLFSYSGDIVYNRFHIKDNILFSNNKRMSLSGVDIEDIEGLVNNLYLEVKRIDGIADSIIANMSADIMELCFSEEAIRVSSDYKDKPQLIKMLEAKKKDDLIDYFLKSLNITTESSPLENLEVGFVVEKMQVTLHYYKSPTRNTFMSYYGKGIPDIKSSILNFLLSYDELFGKVNDVITQLKS